MPAAVLALFVDLAHESSRAANPTEPMRLIGRRCVIAGLCIGLAYAAIATQ